MISKSLLESNRQFFLKNPREKMKVKKLEQTEKQLEMLITKYKIQITELFSLIK